MTRHLFMQTRIDDKAVDDVLDRIIIFKVGPFHTLGYFVIVRSLVDKI